MAGFTNKAKAEMLLAFVRGAALPSSFYFVLVTSATAPNADTNILSDLTEIAAGNGYTSGGIQLAKNATSFPGSTPEDDTNNKGTLGIKSVPITASGGNIPASGNPARYAVITGPGSTIGSRKVYFWFDLGSNQTIADGTIKTFGGGKIELKEAA